MVITVKVVGYCRVSTKKDDQLNSLEAQKTFFEEFAKRNNYELVKIYADKGITGLSIKKRKELQQLVTDSYSNNSFDMILIKDISRLARNTQNLLQLIGVFKQNKKKVYFSSYNMEAQELSEFNITLLGAVAQEESRNISVRVKASKKRNASNGKVPNFVYGYNKIKGELLTLEINEEESKIVREIFDMYVNNKYGATKISITLNNRGLRTKRDKLWTQNAISRILKNEIYIGIVINGREKVEDYLTGERMDNPPEEWEVKYNENLRIIEDDLYIKAQKLLQERYVEFGNDIKRKKESNKYIFSTLIKCKHCNYSFRRQHFIYPSGREYLFWVCSGRNTKGVDSCPNNTKIDEQDLINALEIIMRQVIESKEYYINNIKKEFKYIYDKRNSSVVDLKELHKELKTLERDLQKENDLYREDLIDLNTLKENAKPIKVKIVDIKEQISMLEQEITVEDKIDDILKNTFKDINSILDISKVNNADLKRVIDKIEVDADKNVVIYFKLLGKVGMNSTFHNSDVCPYRCQKDERNLHYHLVFSIYSQV